MTETLLPRNRTKWEEAISLVNASRRPVPWHLLARLWNPWTCPIDVLPYLANALSVDLWFDDWDEQKKRLVTARAFELHRLKGRVEAVRQHVPFVGSRLVRAITPPAKTFLMANLTDEERRAYLDVFAQIRIRPYVAYGYYPYAHFTSSAFKRSKAFLDACYPVTVITGLRYRHAAYFWDHTDTETELTTRNVAPEEVADGLAQRYVEVMLPRRLPSSIFLDQPPKEHIYLGEYTGAPERIFIAPESYRATVSLPRETYTTLLPTGALVSVYPEKVFEKHQRQKGDLFLGEPLWKQTMPPSIAWRYVYDRYFLHDPDRVSQARKASVHLGYTRLGLPAFNAEYNIAIRGKRPPREAARFVSGFLSANAHEPLKRTVFAVKVAKAARDKAMVNTTTMRAIAIRDRAKIGDRRTLGEFIGV